MKSYSDNIIDTSKIDSITHDHDAIKLSVTKLKMFLIVAILTQLAFDVLVAYKLFF